jgi:hypothetical protein
VGLTRGEGCASGIYEILRARDSIRLRQGEHPWESISHTRGEGALVIESDSDEIRGELQQCRASIRRPLRHQHQGLSVATRDLDHVIFGLSEHIRRVLAQI